jgi:hypothetical protein
VLVALVQEDVLGDEEASIKVPLVRKLLSLTLCYGTNVSYFDGWTVPKDTRELVQLPDL